MCILYILYVSFDPFCYSSRSISLASVVSLPLFLYLTSHTHTLHSSLWRSQLHTHCTVEAHSQLTITLTLHTRHCHSLCARREREALERQLVETEQRTTREVEERVRREAEQEMRTQMEERERAITEKMERYVSE